MRLKKKANTIMPKAKNTSPNNPIIIKKYTNRRLYDTGRSSYVKLKDLCEMIKAGHDFIVLDVKSNTDITRSVLIQIILDQESSEEALISVAFMKSLIGLYDKNMQTMASGYLENTLDTFIKNQEQLQDHINKEDHIQSLRSNITALQEEINRLSTK